MEGLPQRDILIRSRFLGPGGVEKPVETIFAHKVLVCAHAF